MPQNRWRPGLRPGPRWGSLNAPPNPPVATLGALPLELGRYAPSGASRPRVTDTKQWQVLPQNEILDPPLMEHS